MKVKLLSMKLLLLLGMAIASSPTVLTLPAFAGGPYQDRSESSYRDEETQLRAVIKQNPKNPKAYLQLGLLLEDDAAETAFTPEESGYNYTEVIQVYRDAIAIVSPTAEIYFRLGRSLYFSQLDDNPADVKARKKEGLGHIQRSTRMDPKNDQYRIELKRLEVLQEKEAAGVARQKETEVPSSQPAQAKSLNQLNNAELHKRAYALEGQGKPAEEEAIWEQIVRQFPGNVSDYSNFGMALLGNKKPAKAVTACRQALKIDSRYTLALLCLRSGLVKQEKYAEAEAMWQKMIQEHPKDIGVYTDLGYILMKQGKLRESATVCKQALTIIPKDEISSSCLTNTLIQQNKVSEAIAVVDNIVSAYPSERRSIDTQRYVMLGNQLQSYGYVNEAIAVYRKAIQFDPNNPQPQQELKRVFEKSKVVTISPDPPKSPFLSLSLPTYPKMEVKDLRLIHDGKKP